MINRICEICTKEFKAYPSEIKYRGAKFCGISCASKWKAQKRDISGKNNPMYRKGYLIAGEKNGRYGKYGDLNYQWKGGVYQRKDGYIRLSFQGKKVLEHRLVIEQKLGRRLASEEIIHHKNEVKDDNSLDNLLITDRPDHARIHFHESKVA